jgi:hypothetical protein
VADPQVSARRVFGHSLKVNGQELPALPVPLAPVFRPDPTRAAAPRLGETQDPLLSI